MLYGKFCVMYYLVMPVFLALFNVSTVSHVIKAKEPLKIGALIPRANVKMENCGGAIVRLKDAGRDNGLLVVFSSNTCVAVVENQLRMLDVANYALSNKVGVIILNPNERERDGAESKETMKAYADELGFKWLYVIDKNSAMADAFGARRTPECFLFHRLGKLVYKGAIDDCPKDEKQVSHQYLKQAITETAAGKSVTVAETEAAGCAIKRK